MTDNLTATATLHVPTAAVFAVLADPSSHSAIDGTGWVRDALDDQVLTRVGQVFWVAMYHSNHPEGDYEMANTVIAFVPDRVIAWEPGQANNDGVIETGGWTWRYDLEPLSAQQTRVVLTYDWSAVPTEVRRHITFPPFSIEHLDNSLVNLAAVAGDPQPG